MSTTTPVIECMFTCNLCGLMNARVFVPSREDEDVVT
jgi:hypothetical protein